MIIDKIKVAAMKETGWIRLFEADKEAIALVKEEYGLKHLDQVQEESAIEEGGFILLPIKLPIYSAGNYVEVKVIMALREDLLITVAPSAIDALDDVASKINEVRSLEYSAVSTMYILIQALNDATHNTLDQVDMYLHDIADQVLDNLGGFELGGKMPGVADISDTAVMLGESEELLARIIEGQLMLARALRWMRRLTKNQIFPREIDTLLSDVRSTQKQARFQHDKIRNLQQSLMTTLDLKQNHVVKIFTVITAIFVPPTLVGAFYGQNFAYMPELSLLGGEWVVMFLTGLFALIPMVYIKYKGWLR